MTIVVADTSPLNYLVQIGCVDVLSFLFKRALIPQAVLDELRDIRTPVSVRDWVSNLPAWIEVHTPAPVSDEALSSLDVGEREAICLAEQAQATVLLIDERLGARLARKRGLLVTGTLGILLEASSAGFIDLEDVLERLARTTFRHTPQLFDQVRALTSKRTDHT